MAKLALAVEPGAPKRLLLQWKSGFKKLTVALDGKVFGTAEKKSELTQGVSFPFPEGGTLTVRLRNAVVRMELVVERDGEPLPGSATDPVTQIRRAAYALYLVAGITVAVGLALMTAGHGNARVVASMIGTVIEGVIFAVLGFLTLKKSMIALGLAIALYVADAGFALVDQVQAGKPNLWFLIVRIILLTMMVNGLVGMRALRARGRAAKEAA